MIKLKTYLAGSYIACILAPLCKLLEALFQLCVPLVVAHMIDHGVAAQQIDIIKQDTAILACLAGIGFIISTTGQYLSSKLSARFGTKVRNALFFHIMHLDQTTIDRIGRASLVSRITNDTLQVQDGLNRFVRLVLRSPFVTIGSIIAAFSIQPQLACLLLAVLTTTFVLVVILMIYAARRFRSVQEQLDALRHTVSRNLEGTRTLRAFRRESAEIQTCNERTRAVAAAQIPAGAISSLVGPLSYCMLQIALVALLWLGANLVNSAELTQGSLIALSAYITQVLVELVRFAWLVVLMAQAHACARRINEVFALPCDHTGAITGAIQPLAVKLNNLAATANTHLRLDSNASHNCSGKITHARPALAFYKVGFSYPQGARALKDISFCVYPGQTLGIIGGTGSGKSTIGVLALNLYTPSSGSISVHGRPITSFDAHELHHIVIRAEQNPHLFAGTIKSNIAWSNTNHHSDNHDQLFRALKQAQAIDFAHLDDPVSRAGTNLSGGQRQRISLARALVRACNRQDSILILDDATSALDHQTSAHIQKTLADEFSHITKIIISQHIRAVRDADHILVMHNGCIVARGTHQELLSNSKLYQDIARSQNGGLA